LLKRPHWEFQFDYDSTKAAETRIRHFDRIVEPQLRQMEPETAGLSNSAV
jgi:hypothetical protein